MPPSIRIPGLPEEAQPLILQLLQEDLLPVATLQSAVESYRRVIHKISQQNGKANTVVGDEIAHALQTLLGRVNMKTGNDNMRILQAAVRYFVIQNDGHGHDLETRDGLYDDARVVNAVARYFGRDDLVVKSLPTSSSGRGSTLFPR